MKKILSFIFFSGICLLPITAETRQNLNQDILDKVDQDIKEILESPEFDPWETKIRPKWKSKKKEENTVTKSVLPEELLDQIAEITAAILPWLLVLSLFIIFIAIIIIKKKSIMNFFGSLSSKDKNEKTIYLEGTRIEKAGLPSEIVQKAKQLWKEGKPKLAMSLIYRGAISYFMNKMKIPIPDSATEDECLHQVNESLSGHINFQTTLSDYSRLIHTWLYSAYANRHPGDTEFYSLCDHWDKYFKDQE